MIIDGLTDFQKALVSTERNLDKSMREAMRVEGNKATAYVRKKAKNEVKKKTGNYQKGFKRGKIFIGNDGAVTVRVYNGSPHAHLIEDGHEMVSKTGEKLGRFVHGKQILKKGIAEFEQTFDPAKNFADAIDRLLEKNKL